MPQPTTSACLVCDRPAKLRGLCGRCYQAARNAIYARQTTEDELIKKRLILPRYANAKRSAFMEALMRTKLGKSRFKAPSPERPIMDEKPKIDPWTLALWDMT